MTALAPVERPDAWYVCWRGDPSDWIARFEKDSVFDARGWAHSLAAAFNARLDDQVGTPA